ncbi:spore germination protein [Paenibacillus medicaginis]|uniref:Spore germination protein n=1 Tax=Paenibacillus medicaginis TaxID=1470560 RepID=A0ABV5C1W3_9BACL
MRDSCENQNSRHSKVLTSSLEQTVLILQQKMGKSTDFIIRELSTPLSSSPSIAVSYIAGLVDQQLLAKLMEALALQVTEGAPSIHIEAWLGSQLPVGNLKSLDTEEDVVSSILEGEVIIIVNGSIRVFAVGISGGAKRAIEEPSSQTVIRGPKEGFTEDIAINIALLRRRIKSPDLCIEPLRIGKYTQTKVYVSYIQGIADPEVVAEIMKRLNSIEIDSVLESGYIEEFIQDGGIGCFPTIYNTERPDSVAGGLLEGVVAIFVDGTPFVLLAPATFFRFFTSSEDYYERYDLSSFLRIIRLASFAVSLFLPALYIATTTFQQEMLPTTLLISLAAQRENIPLPALLEALIMELTFEVIREAGIRMPRAIGPAISIVGALVLGQAAVQAGLVSAAMVIVVSFTAISNFVIPSITMAGVVRLLRFVLMILAGSFGMYGILVGFVPILFRIVTAQSFGVPYFMTITPINKTNLKDLVIRAPWWLMKTRPKLIGDKNRHRQPVKSKPFAQQAMENKRDPLE